MPTPRNKKIVQAINRVPTFDDTLESTAPLKKALIAPLDAILSVDVTAPDAQKKLIQAMKIHEDFWAKPPFGIDKRDAASEVDDNLFLENKPEDFAAIKKAAAEQRVLIGLKQVADEAVLLGILNSQDNALREYIGKQAKLGQLDAVSGWKTGAPPVLSKDLIPDTLLPVIKKNAAESLLALKIAKTTNNTLLKDLLLADNPVKIKAAVRALDVPHDLASIPDDVKEAARKLYVKSAYSALLAVPNAFPDLRAHVAKGDAQFKAHMQEKLGGVEISDAEIRAARAELIAADNKYIKEAYSAYLTGAGASEPLPGLKTLLTGDDPAFITHMQTKLNLPAAVFSPEQIKSTRTQLASFYLERQLKITALPSLKAEDINGLDDVAKMIAFIGKPPLSESNAKITAGVTETSLNSLKLVLLNKFIASLPIDKVAALAKLHTVTDLNGLKPVLSEMGIKPVDWVDAGAVQNIRDIGKVRLDEIRVAQVASHSKQITTRTDIDGLINDAKISNLADFKNKLGRELAWMDTLQMKQLQQEMRNRALDLKVASLAKFGSEQHAKLIDVLHRLPEDKQLELLDPKNLTLSHLLRASDAARIKYDLGDKIKLETGSPITIEWLVKEIIQENERVASFQKVHNSAFAKVLASFGTSPALTADDINKLNDKLRTIDLSNQTEVEALADLVFKLPRTAEQNQARNDLVSAITREKTAIEKQRTINEPLAGGYAVKRVPVKALLDVLLRLNVAVDFEKDKATFDGALLRVLGKHHEKVEDFITDLCKAIVPKGQVQTLEAALKKELSQAEYRNIANGWKKELLTHGGGDSAQKTALLSSIASMLAGVKPLLELAKPLEAYAKAKPTGFIYDATTREYGAATKKAEYMARLETNTLTLDRLLRAQKQVEEYLAIVPAKPTDSTMKQIRAELEKNKLALDEAIKHCRAAQEKIIATINDISRIMAGKEHFLYSAPGIVHKEMTAAERQAFFTAGTAHVSGTINVSDEIAAKVKLEDDKSAYTSMITDNSGAKPTIGQIRHTFATAPHSEVGSEGRISHRVNVKVEMVEPPREENGKAGPPHAQVNMYMTMALSLIVANGGKAPTKENPIRLSGGTDQEMERLWTALHIVCKEKYGYKHAQFMDAVKIDTGGFDPDKVMTTRRFREPVFNEGSQFTKLFHGDAGAKRVLNLKLDDVGKINAAEKAHTVQMTQGGKALVDYKVAVSSTRTAAALNDARVKREKEGVADPESENKSRQQLGG